MIKFVKGDFFDFEADIRINTVNCVGVMGAGVALLFKNRYPDMFNDYAQACSKNEVRPGKPHVWKQTTMFSQLTIINFPTKDDWKNPSEYVYIEKGLIWLKDYLLDNKQKTVTMPALGCGHGGLDWNVVSKMIISALKDVDCEILVFEPSSSTDVKLPEQTEESLKKNDIYKLSPDNDLYPDKIKGRSGSTIYYKGNVDLLKKKSISLIVNSQPNGREIRALDSLIDEFPKSNDYVFLLGLNGSYETDLIKKVLSKGLNTIVVLPYGLLKLKVRKDLQEYIKSYNNLFVSLTDPDKAWKTYESVNSLKFRFKTADVLLINSFNFEKLEKFENDINKGDNKKFYLNYWTDSVSFFNHIEANKIGLNSKTKKPNIESLLASLK